MAVMSDYISQPDNHVAVHAAVTFIFLYFFYVTGCIDLAYLYCSEIAHSPSARRLRECRQRPRDAAWV